ncbi:MAG: hypothetical protein NVSMB27_18390 [Ktedonobacteraceae bacterium]
MHIFQQRFLVGGIVVVFLLVGCGSNAGSGATPTPTGKPTQQPPTLPVTLQVGAASYPLGSVISVTIKNQSGQTISFPDHRTNCTVLLLERQVASSWVPVAPCKLMIVTRIHSLNTGEVQEVKLITSNQWPAGLYRARLDYGVGPGFGTPKIIYSSEFHVG